MRTIKIYTTFILIIISFSSLFAQHNFNTISAGEFLIDENKKLIIINQDLSTFNSYIEGTLNSITLNKNYLLKQEIDTAELGKSYELLDENDNTYQLYFTQLPIIHITSENKIVNEPKVVAQFHMFESSGNITDEIIGIELRGASSQKFPKKSYGIEFWQDETDKEEKDVSLLGMREDGDWILQAMYNEPLRMNDIVSFDLWQQIDTLYYQRKEAKAVNGINMKYVELFINEAYQGIYYLGEKIDRKQLKLKKLKDNVIRGELYKGYQYAGPGFYELTSYDNSSSLWNGYELKYPKPDEKIEWSNIYNLFDFALQSSDSEFLQNVEEKFHMENIINYFIFINTAAAADNTGKNTFIAKYDTDGPYFIVPWDLDGTFGVWWDGSNNSIEGKILSNGLYNRLQLGGKESKFLQDVSKRWYELRNQDIISYNSIVSLFNKYIDYLESNAVYERESIAWEDYTYPENQLQYMSDWVEMRISVLDNYFAEIHTATNKTATNNISTYPNPVDKTLNINHLQNHSYAIYSLMGEKLVEAKGNGGHTQVDISSFAPGLYILSTERGDQVKFLKK